MKRYILTFLAGLLVGALGVLVLQETTARSGSPTSGVTQADLESAIAKALRGVEKQISELRESAEKRLDSGGERPAAPGTSRTTVPNPDGPAANGAEPPARARRPAAPTRPEGESLGPARIDRLREIEGFNRHEDVRRRWLFRDDADVLADLGAPSGVDSIENGVERWRYEIPVRNAAGEDDTQSIYLFFREGRLIRVQL